MSSIPNTKEQTQVSRLNMSEPTMTTQSGQNEKDSIPTALVHDLTRESRFAAQIKLLPNIARDLESTKNIKIENCIGFTQIPIGLAGPLIFNGTYQDLKTIYAPLATVEATVVAATSRGCKVFSACGGISASALEEGLARAPVFVFSTIPEALAFYRLVPSLLGFLKKVSDRSSRHGSLVSVKPKIIGSTVHVKFTYNCGDAAGQNMVTLSTHAACHALMEENRPAGLIDYQLEANFSSDKKLSWGSVHEPRGVSVIAWGTISDEICQKMLRTSSRRLKAILTRLDDGAARNGQMGLCVNTSNVMAAMFASCGQDMASVLESGFSHLTAELNEETGDLTLSVFFPSILVGTVGGATGYPAQKEALELIGCYGDGKKWALAETIAGFALALELSSLGAFATDTFAASHKDLARGAKSKL